MKQLSELKNVFVPSRSEIKGCIGDENRELFKRNMTLEDIKEATVVAVGRNFTMQQWDATSSNGEGIFYIQKYKKLFLYDEFCEFVENHSDEKFILLKDGDTGRLMVRVYIDNSRDNILKLTFFNACGGEGKMCLLATLSNQEGKAVWATPEIFNPDVKRMGESENSRRYGIEDNPGAKIVMGFTEPYYNDGRLTEVRQYRVFEEDGRDMTTEEIMKAFLKIPGHTRIVSSVSYSFSIYYDIALGEAATGSIRKRYGICGDEDKEGWSYYSSRPTRYINNDSVFPEADLDESVMKRIKDEITFKLKNKEGKRGTLPLMNYSSTIGRNIETYSVLVISKPVAGHRRPTYHIIKGFKNTGAIDIVELARGELSIKNVTPVNCYYLSTQPTDREDKFKYCQITHNLFGNVKDNLFAEAHVDRISFAEWTEEKSLHPELMRAFIAKVDEKKKNEEIDINWDEVKVFNRTPFGALFMEHLIQAGYIRMALKFAEYITYRADRWDYVCNSMTDVIPGYNNEGTSLIKGLGLSKPCYDLLFNNITDHSTDVGEFKAIYKAIKRFAPDGILTKDRQRTINQYIELYRMGRQSYQIEDRSFDLIDYPAEMKSVYKMYNKIATVFEDKRPWEACRHYAEIIKAYLCFKSHDWIPEENMIFIEFGLGEDKEAALKMLYDREHAANTTLSNFAETINIANKKRLEEKYLYRRKHALEKLEWLKTPPKATGWMTEEELREDSEIKMEMANYVVMAPSQIYGEDVVGSIEKEGKDMGHCVFRQYASEIANGTYTVLYLRSKYEPEKSLVTIGINNEGRINQTYGEGDSMITEEQARAIAAWAKSKKGLVTFKSEHSNINPGGWISSSTAIPSLPVPDKEWLIKLSRTEKEA